MATTASQNSMYNLVSNSMSSTSRVAPSWNVTSQSTLTSFTEALKNAIQTYMTNVEKSGYQSEIYNTNLYMQQSMSAQQEQILDQSNQARNNIMKLRQVYQLKMYDINDYNYLTSSTHFSLFIFSFCVLLISLSYKTVPAKLSPMITWSIIAFVIVLYVMVKLTYMTNNMYRKKTDWTKYYFNSSSLNKNSCSNN